MDTITKAEWVKTHRDFKCVINGTRYIMRYEGGRGTVLAPVQVEGMPTLPTRYEALKRIASREKPGIVDNVSVRPETARAMLNIADKDADPAKFLADLRDFSGIIRAAQEGRRYSEPESMMRALGYPV